MSELEQEEYHGAQVDTKLPGMEPTLDWSHSERQLCEEGMDGASFRVVQIMRLLQDDDNDDGETHLP